MQEKQKIRNFGLPSFFTLMMDRKKLFSGQKEGSHLPFALASTCKVFRLTKIDFAEKSGKNLGKSLKNSAFYCGLDG